MLPVKSLSRVPLSVTPWTAACQAPLSMGFSRWEYWRGLPPGLQTSAACRAFWIGGLAGGLRPLPLPSSQGWRLHSQAQFLSWASGSHITEKISPMSSMCVYVWGTLTDLLHLACSVLALKGETESSGEHTAPGEARHRHSSCPTDSRVVSPRPWWQCLCVWVCVCVLCLRVWCGGAVHSVFVCICVCVMLVCICVLSVSICDRWIYVCFPCVLCLYVCWYVCLYVCEHMREWCVLCFYLLVVVNICVWVVSVSYACVCVLCTYVHIFVSKCVFTCVVRVCYVCTFVRVCV